MSGSKATHEWPILCSPMNTPPRPENDPHFEEFDDEPAGAVLFEMRPGRWEIVWGALNAVAAAAVTAARSWFKLDSLPVSILEGFVPLSALLGLVAAVFLRLNLPADTEKCRITRWSALLHAGALIPFAVHVGTLALEWLRQQGWF